jgi:hypothetical protein
MKCLVRRVVQLENELEELRSMGARPATVESASGETATVE